MARRRLFPLFPLLSALFVLSTLPSFAQYTANIQGVVLDQSGAGVPKASINLMNVATSATKATESDASGNYRFVNIAPGSYKLTVQAAGLRRPRPTSRFSPSRISTSPYLSMSAPSAIR